MNVIRVFLVLEENGKNVCYLEETELQSSSNSTYNIMRAYSNNKSGLSLKGKKEEKEKIIFELLKYYKDELNKERKELDEKLKLFHQMAIDCL